MNSMTELLHEIESSAKKEHTDMNNTKDVKERYNELKEEVQAYKQSLYKDYPQVAKFENRKRTCIKFLLLLLFMHVILRVYTLQSVTEYNIFLLFVTTMIKVDWIFLLAAMSPKWQLSLLLYLMALNNGWEFISSLTNAGISSFETFIEIYRLSFQQFPLVAASDIIIAVYIIAAFIVAGWLTLLPKNREYAEQSEVLNSKIKDFAASRS